MSKYLVVGGGFSGLLCAKLLADKGIDFIGLEASDALGGHTDALPLRFFDRSSTEYFSAYWPQTEWIFVEESCVERKKGQWEISPLSEEPREEFFMKSGFYTPNTNSPLALDEETQKKFQLRKQVRDVDPATPKVICQDGTEYEFTELFWCSDLSELAAAWLGEKGPVLGFMKELEGEPSIFHLDFKLKNNFLERKNSVLFPFRFKDHRLNALGIDEKLPNGDYRLRWIVFLPEEISADREEIAKCVRALKREVLKEFSNLTDLIADEKITYYESLPGGLCIPARSLKILPHVTYVGPELRLAEDVEEPKWLERSLRNAKLLEAQLATN